MEVDGALLFIIGVIDNPGVNVVNAAIVVVLTLGIAPPTTASVSLI